MTIIEKMSLDLNLDTGYLTNLASNAFRYYRSYNIPKKNGKLRRISQPSPELKTVQYWIVENILSKIPVAPSACAYSRGSSIKKHADLHKNSRFFLHIDIHHFFPSIHSSHLIPFLEKHKDVFYSSGFDYFTDLYYLKKICFRKDMLCIGAVSSPIISNIIMYDFDISMDEYCQNRNFIYTRYADDIYISSRRFINPEVFDHVKSHLESLGFAINPDKSRFFSSKGQKKVTGLILTTDNQISVGTVRRNEIKKLIYDKLVHHVGDAESILGYLSFLRDIEPDTYNNIIIKYRSYCKGDLFEAIKQA